MVVSLIIGLSGLIADIGTRDFHFLVARDSYLRGVLVRLVLAHVFGDIDGGATHAGHKSNGVSHGGDNRIVGGHGEQEVHLAPVAAVVVSDRLVRIYNFAGADAHVVEHLLVVILGLVGDGLAEGEAQHVAVLRDALDCLRDNRVHAVFERVRVDVEVVFLAAFGVGEPGVDGARVDVVLAAGEHERAEAA